ncbi:MAG: type I methionyl aminopeptidase [Candidatus Beckwithbacteria bacterium]|nr:type I methionyl aminopeptidase [Candidatus Beckwithbacteria bacterium]
MILKTDQDFTTYRRAAKISLKILKNIVESVKPGILPLKLDDLTKKFCHEAHVRPAFLGVGRPDNPYQYATCISVNDTAVHGIPSPTEPLKIGDLVKIDFGLIYQNYYTDFCVTVGVKSISPQQEKLLQTAKKSVQSSIALAIPGNTTGDVGHNMHQVAREAGFDVLKQYTGHGIGHTLHDKPVIPAHGQPHQGEVFLPNMVVCLENQVVEKSDQVYQADDGWSVKTTDGGLVGMFEYMVVVKDQPEVLTPTFDWPLVI